MECIIKTFDELTVHELYQIIQIRTEIFVVEQKCSYQDLDDKDQAAYHVYLRDAQGIQAYLRVLGQGVAFKEAAIGRVVTRRRGAGLGLQVVLAGIDVARTYLHADVLRIGAQLYAKEFYEKAGFRQASEMYLEDGIPHIEMILDTKNKG